MQACSELATSAVSLSAEIGATVSPEIEASIQARRATYVSRLLKHDWSYDWSDDGSVRRAGRHDRAWLLLEAAAIDPSYELWNRHCPAEYRRAPL